jgi:hypothetical protein
MKSSDGGGLLATGAGLVSAASAGLDAASPSAAAAANLIALLGKPSPWILALGRVDPFDGVSFRALRCILAMTFVTGVAAFTLAGVRQ